VHVGDFPVGDPAQVRELLREHVVKPLRQIAALPPARPGPIRCAIGEQVLYLDPGTGRILSDRPHPAWSEPEVVRRWRIEWRDGVDWVYGPQGPVEPIPAALGDVGAVEVSPDGRLLLAVCRPIDVARLDPADEGWGGVVLWDRRTKQGWLLHPDDSSQMLMGPITGVDFYPDDRCFLITTPNGYNGCVVACDVTRLPSPVDGGGGWLGTILDYSPTTGTLWLWERTCSFDWGHNALVACWDAAEYPDTVSWYGFTMEGRPEAYAVAPVGRAFCGIDRREDGANWYRPVFVVYRKGQVHEYDLAAGDLGEAMASIDAASWSPDARALVIDARLAEEGDGTDASAPRHRLLLLDATTGSHRALATTSAPLEPVWLQSTGGQ
jgi:hypothetical protein